MNLSFIEAFYWVATLQSVSRAAQKLHVTQSAVSARLFALEQELGAPLLDRRERHFRLTTAGQAFLADAERLLELWRKSKANLGGGRARPAALRIGAIESVLHSWLIPWLESMRSEGNELQLELTVESTPVLSDLTQRGALDLVFSTLPVGGSDMRSQAFPPMPMVFAGKRGLHDRRHYSLKQIVEYDLLTFQRGSQPHVALLDVLRGAGIEPGRVHAISSISALIRLVSAGFGVAVLPRAALEPVLVSAGLRVLTCDTPLIELPVHASWRADPVSNSISEVVESATRFVERPARLPRRSSKKSML